LQQLTGLGHHEAQAVQVDQDFKKFWPFERLDGVGEIATLAKGNDEIGSGLGAAGGDTVWSRHHGIAFSVALPASTLTSGVCDR